MGSRTEAVFAQGSGAASFFSRRSSLEATVGLWWTAASGLVDRRVFAPERKLHKQEMTGRKRYDDAEGRGA